MKRQYITPALRSVNLDSSDYLLAGAGSNSYDESIGVASHDADNQEEVLAKETSLWDEIW